MNLPNTNIPISPTPAQTSIDSLSKLDISKLSSQIDRTNLDALFPFLVPKMKKYAINTPLRIAHFFAQVMVESKYFQRLEESLNYSPAGLISTFGYFKNNKKEASRLGRKAADRDISDDNKRQIADDAYNDDHRDKDHQMGNKAGTDDGYNYRGRGLLQITGRGQYAAFSQKAGMDFISNPQLVSTPEWAVESAAWYWFNHRGNEFADLDDFVQVTYHVNGGFNGVGDRLIMTERAKTVFNLTIDNTRDAQIRKQFNLKV